MFPARFRQNQNEELASNVVEDDLAEPAPRGFGSDENRSGDPDECDSDRGGSSPDGET